MRKILLVLSCSFSIAVVGVAFVHHKSKLSTTAGSQVKQVSLAPIRWHALSADLEQPLEQIQFLDQLNGWGISSNALWRTEDGGIHWTKVADSSISTVLSQKNKGIFYKMQFLSQQEAWLLEDSHLLHTTDGGRNWKRTEFTDTVIRSFRFLSSGLGWAVGEALTRPKNNDENETWRGAVFATKDAGVTWHEISLNVHIDDDWAIFDIWPINETKIWLVGDLVLCTEDSGRTWKRIRLEDRVYGEPVSVQFSGDTLGWITTNQGNRFLVTKNGGKSWEQREGPSEMGGFSSMIFISPSDVLSVAGDIFYSADGGITWAKEAEGHYYCLYNLKNLNLAFAAGNSMSVRSIN